MHMVPKKGQKHGVVDLAVAGALQHASGFGLT
jgi:hypothetical protein